MIKAQLKIIIFSYSKYIIINKSMLFQAFQLLDTITIFNDKNTVEKHRRNLQEVIQFRYIGAKPTTTVALGGLGHA